MLCQLCGKNQAVVFIEEAGTNNGLLGICRECAEKNALGLPFLNSDNLKELLEKLTSDIANYAASKQSRQSRDCKSHVKHEEIVCPTCSWTYSQFEKTRLFGCPQCCRTFSDKLDKIIYETHRGRIHTGKFPQMLHTADSMPDIGTIFREQNDLKREIEILRKGIDESVRREEFEFAAELRDKIIELENKLAAVDK